MDKDKKYTLELNREQIQVVHDLVWIAIKNGNSVCDEAYAPTPEQYKTLCAIANKI